MIDEKKQKAIELALKQIDKAFGKGALVRLGDKQVEKIDAISTGSLGLDMALGIGGVPKGRIIEIYGPESSGKTTLSLQIVAECQRNGGIAAFIDALSFCAFCSFCSFGSWGSCFCLPRVAYMLCHCLKPHLPQSLYTDLSHVTLTSVTPCCA